MSFPLKARRLTNTLGFALQDESSPFGGSGVQILVAKTLRDCAFAPGWATYPSRRAGGAMTIVHAPNP